MAPKRKNENGDSKPSKSAHKSSSEERGKKHHEEAQEEHTDGNNEWKTRPPYRIHDDNDKFHVEYEANCHCGRVKYQLSRKEPLASKLCHCTTCQTQHAAPFQWAAIFHKEDINFVSGHHDLEWYDPSTKKTEHHLPCKVRCSFCHSPIMDEGRNMVLLFPSLVHLDDEGRKNFKPRCHIFYSQRAIDVPDGLPKWSKIDKQSELIEDSPPDMVKEQNRKMHEHADEMEVEKNEKSGDDEDEDENEDEEEKEEQEDEDEED